MIDEYIKALRTGEKEQRQSLARGGQPFPPALEELLPDSSVLQHKPLGLMEIPVRMIEGTVTSARKNSFAPGFMPLLEPDSEFAAKWSNLYLAQINEGFSDPIKVYEYLHRFYVLEGNKRVSVSRYLDMPSIMADVTRIIPDTEVLSTNPVYAEFLRFYSVCPLYDIDCSIPGSYEEIAGLLGRSLPGQDQGHSDARQDPHLPWPDDEVNSLRSTYWTFSRVFDALGDRMTEMPDGDAFLIYLKIYTQDAFMNQPDKEVDRRLRRIKKELSTARNSDNVSLLESSDDVLGAGNILTKTGSIITRPGSVIGKVLPVKQFSLKKPLRAAFVYDRDPLQSNWLYNHEMGRLRVEESYHGLIRTAPFIAGSSPDGNIRAIEEAVDWGADIVFTTSVKQMADTLRSAIRHESVVFLNCSINLAHQAVRTYYAKLYEAKFLAGVVAGTESARDGSHRIGYCSDYPIYGTIAGINAFAIGAAMMDPEVKIVLEWAGRQDNNWWWSMVDRGIHVISAFDSTHNVDGSSAYGVCYVDKCAPGEGNDLSGSCRIRNLAAPVWKWGRLYEIIIRTVLDGNYHAPLVDRKDQATNYWWGMISGVVDIKLSNDLPVYTRQLVNILKSDIIRGTLNPFDGELRSQTGIIRSAGDPPLTSMDVIRMDWLNENVEGQIPEAWMLTDDAKETVSVSGVRKQIPAGGLLKP